MARPWYRNESYVVTGVTLVFAVIFLLFLAISGRAQKKEPKKEICITFNELPESHSFQDADREALAYLILQTLKAHEVTAAGFVVGERVESSFDLLGQWLNEGHVLGNMTYSNQDLHEIGIEKFIENTQMGHDAIEQMIEGFGQKKRYFRFPFLHYGNDIEAKRQVMLYLEHMNYTVAHATVIPEDYLYNLTLEKMGRVPDSAEFERLLNEYINSVLDELERQEALAKELMGRPVRQILLLHFNRLNAVYLDEMLTAMEDMGYEFVSLDKALNDEMYDITEGYFGGRGVSYIEMLLESNPDMIPAQPRE